MVAGQVQDDSSRHELDTLWRATQDRLRTSVPESTFRLWLEPLAGSRLRCRHPLPDRPGGDPRLGRAALLGPDRRSPGRLGNAAATGRFQRRPRGPRTETLAIDGAELNPSYTFDRFVIGGGNRLAHGAALAVAEALRRPTTRSSSHGPPGLGKTHLLAAIANYLRANAPGLSVRYTTAESFTNEFVGALRSAGAEAFKARPTATSTSC